MSMNRKAIQVYNNIMDGRPVNQKDLNEIKDQSSLSSTS